MADGWRPTSLPSVLLVGNGPGGNGPGTLGLARTVLAGSGFDVRAADGTGEPGALIHDPLWTPAVMVMHMDDGLCPALATIRRIRSNAQWQHVPLVLLCGRISGEDLAAALPAGADSLVSTPFSPQSLVHDVAAAARAGRNVQRRNHLNAESA